MTTAPDIAKQIEKRLGEIAPALVAAREALKQVEAEEAALLKALRALAPDSEHLPVKPVAKPGRKGKQKQVSEAMLNRVRDAVVQAPEPVTIKHIAGVVGVSESAVSFATRELRGRQEIRLAGYDSSTRGKPSLFAPMNGASNA